MVASPAATDAAGGRGFAVYVHWPFCRSKCPYCDFNSHVRESIDQAAWRDAYLREIAYTAGRLGRRRVDSIFFGGGTPSLMPPATVAAVIDAIAGHWTLADNVEITLEANPTSAEAENFRAAAAAGVNRISLGVQALDDADLKALGREHSAAEALAAMEMAAGAVPRWSFDLIYARPGQSQQDWRDELSRALGFGAGHMSLYQLTIEPGTAFHTAWRTGALVLPDDDAQADMFAATQEICSAAGLPAYEVSNHARPGQESRHNLVYWRYGEYVGIGPGAHGRPVVDGERRATAGERLPERWLAAVGEAGHGLVVDEPVPVDERASEMLMMGLRLAEGIEREAFRAETGLDPVTWCGGAVGELEQLDLIAVTPARLTVTERGRPLLNAILGRLLAEVAPAAA
jgi:putative oxygen-independent coproporphyrinogen III oxidase